MATWIATIPKKRLRKIYDNYKDVNYDTTGAKHYLLHIIKGVVGDLDVNDCKLNRCSIYGLKLTIKNIDDLTIMFCINSGHVYYSKSFGDYL